MFKGWSIHLTRKQLQKIWQTNEFLTSCHSHREQKSTNQSVLFITPEAFYFLHLGQKWRTAPWGSVLSDTWNKSTWEFVKYPSAMPWWKAQLELYQITQDFYECPCQEAKWWLGENWRWSCMNTSMRGKGTAQQQTESGWSLHKNTKTCSCLKRRVKKGKRRFDCMFYLWMQMEKVPLQTML